MSDVLDALARDHREVERLFSTYAEDADDAVAHAICDALTRHAEVEERVFYPEVRRIVDSGDDLVDVADAEHAAIRSLIARVYESPPPDLRPVMDELRTIVEHHVADEESKLFPELREAGADLEALGRRLEAARAEAG